MAEMLNLDKMIDKLPILLEAIPEIQTVFLFGSYGTIYQTPFSEIDFAVNYNQAQSLRDEAALINRLTITLGTDQADNL